jgi:hypothetical protein
MHNYVLNEILQVVHYVFNPDHYIGIVIANTTLLYYYIFPFYYLDIFFFGKKIKENKK